MDVGEKGAGGWQENCAVAAIIIFTAHCVGAMVGATGEDGDVARWGDFFS